MKSGPALQDAVSSVPSALAGKPVRARFLALYSDLFHFDLEIFREMHVLVALKGYPKPGNPVRETNEINV